MTDWFARCAVQNSSWDGAAPGRLRKCTSVGRGGIEAGVRGSVVGLPAPARRARHQSSDHSLRPEGPESYRCGSELERIYSFPASGRHLVVNFVASVDGAVAVDGLSAGLSDDADRTVLRLGTDLADVVLVGAGTATAEGFRGVHPDLVRAERRRQRSLSPVPPLAVVTRTGSALPPGSPAVVDALVPTLVLTSRAAPARRRAAWADEGAEVVVLGEDGVDLRNAVGELEARGLRRINCLGGPALFGALIGSGAVDELRLTLSPSIHSGAAGRIARAAGESGVPLQPASVLHADDMLFIRYLVGAERSDDAR